MSIDNSYNHQHTHHHHHHHIDSSEQWKRDSLKAIERRKYMAKLTKVLMVITALFMLCAVIFIVMFDK